MKRLYLLGQPIGHSLSPAIHNAALAALGLDWQYGLLEVPAAGLPEAVAQVRADDCVGANVTIPHKETVIRLLDGLGESAREVGAVNTLVKREGRLLGENTDTAGFLRGLADLRIKVIGARVTVLGAGGAARAVCFALAREGTRSLTILNRTPARAERLASELRERFPQTTVRLAPVEPADLAVSAVPAEAPLDWVSLDIAPGAAAYDLNYRLATTPFLREAEARGARTANGLGMLVYQAAASLEIWTGSALAPSDHPGHENEEPPLAAMFAAARRALSPRHLGSEDAGTMSPRRSSAEDAGTRGDNR